MGTHQHHPTSLAPPLHFLDLHLPIWHIAVVFGCINKLVFLIWCCSSTSFIIYSKHLVDFQTVFAHYLLIIYGYNKKHWFIFYQFNNLILYKVKVGYFPRVALQIVSGFKIYQNKLFVIYDLITG
jgi:hypothetical protein